MYRTGPAWIKHFRLALLWGFISLMIVGLSLLAPRKAHAFSGGETAIGVVPLCDTAEEIKFPVVEAVRHGKANAVQAGGDLCSETACAYATTAYVRWADDTTYSIGSGVATVYGFEAPGRGTEGHPPLRQFVAFVTSAQETSLLIVPVHDEWSNGNPVPAWVKSACCGPEDVHHLTSSQVHALADGWHIDGYRQAIAYGRELPSQDGDYWIFYRDFPDGSQTPVYCFFAPARSF